MKDGRTHLAHKAEHAVDLETGAIVEVTIQDAHAGDTTTMKTTVIGAAEHVETVTGQSPVGIRERQGVSQQRAPGRSRRHRSSQLRRRSRSAVADDGAARRPLVLRSTPIDGASVGHAASGCCAGAGSILNGPLRTRMTRAACVASIYAGTRTS